MLKLYIKTHEAINRLLTDEEGAESFEYIIVAACIVAVVVVAFGTGSPLETALKNGLNAISTAITSAVNSPSAG